MGRLDADMKDFLRFAAIDIGSNAIRLLLSAVFNNEIGPKFKKMTLVRMPIRLGRDAFLMDKISDQKILELVTAMKGFQHLINAYAPLSIMACATSAMRVAKNGPQVCRQIQLETGINVEIISGKREAEILFNNRREAILYKDGASMFVDVGGGSTEITVYSEGKAIASESFNIGTVRVLEDMVPKSDWKQLKKWLQTHTEAYPQISAIGSGGNINKTFRLVGGKSGKPIPYKKLKEIATYLEGFSYDQRITDLGMRPDRADVILPALTIYRRVMKWSHAEQIFVPILGLADGMVKILYQKYSNENHYA
jgi:exopolyphosphatase/guanosine-5'-triphosphate,3'-diphosphate pyrophosphatase